MKKFTFYLCLFLFISPFIGAQTVVTSPISTDLSVVDKRVMLEINNEELRTEEMKNRAAGELPHFAHKLLVEYDNQDDGTWDYLNNDMAVWRLRILSTGAKSLNFGFSQFKMSPNAKLILYTADYKDLIGPLTSADNKAHERLWTPIVLAIDHPINAAKIEMTMFNIQGSQLMRQQLTPSNHTALNVSQLVPGIYWVQLQFEDQMINRKLIIH